MVQAGGDASAAVSVPSLLTPDEQRCYLHTLIDRVPGVVLLPTIRLLQTALAVYLTGAAPE